MVLVWAAGGLALAQEAEESAWPQFQGDATHSGRLAGGPEPPYRSAWTYRPDASADQLLTAPVASGTVFVVEGPDGLYAADVRTGQEVWVVERDGPPAVPAIAEVDGTAAVVYTDGRTADDARVLAVALADGEPLWDDPPALEAESRSGVTVEGDQALVADEDGRVYSVALDAGTISWTVKLDEPPSGPAAAAGGAVVVVLGSPGSNAPATVVSLSASTGEVDWSTSPDRAASFGSVASITDGTVVLTLPNGSVYGLSTRDGAQRWSIRFNALVSPFSAPAVDRGSAFLADTTGGLRRVTPDPGVEWLFQFNEGVLRSSPLVVGGSVLLGLGDGSIGAVSAETGHMTWRSGSAGAPVTGLGAAADTVLASRSGNGPPEVVGLVHDPEGSPVDVVSPTVPIPLDIVLAFGAAFVVVGGVLLAAFRGVARPRAPIRDPSADADGDADPSAEGEP
jgi:outer membrane protein assembly factor BamB